MADLGGFDEEYIRSQLKIAEAFHERWDQRLSNHQRAADAVKLLESLGSTLRSAYEALLDRATFLRPLLIEAQRRIDRRDIKSEDLESGSGARSIAEWIADSADLATRRDALLGEIDEMVSGFEAERSTFEALVVDAETVQAVVGIERFLTAVAEASAVCSRQRATRATRERSRGDGPQRNRADRRGMEKPTR